MPEFEDLIKIYQTRVNQALEKYLPPKEDSRLLNAVHYSVLNGGKRLRSILVYLSSELGKTETKTVVSEVESVIVNKIDNTPVAVFDGKHIGLSFHPELDGISIFHEMLFDSSSKLFSNKFENFNAA